MSSLNTNFTQDKSLEITYNWEKCARETFSLYKTIINNEKIF